ncbi:MAG: hypothetical protein R6V85_08940 [Polyangia bacterium]
MRRRKTIPSAAMLLAAIAPALAAGCEEPGADRLDPRPYYGGWLPCLDEQCTTVGEDGIGLMAGEWFARLEGDEGVAPGEIESISVGQREWSWFTRSDRIVIDYGESWQELWVRLESDDVIQIERLTNTVYNDDTDVQDIQTSECLEGEEFDLPDDDPEDWPPDLWTPDRCWSEYWAPLGRAVRVISPGEMLVLGYDPPLQEEEDEEQQE